MPDETRVFSNRERDYLASHKLGRLATIHADGSPRVVPVGYWLNDDGTMDIGGPRMGDSQKFRNIQRDPRVTLVIDDTTPDTDTEFTPGLGRGIQIRGRAEALTGHRLPSAPAFFSSEIIRIHPEHALSWHVDPERPGLQALRDHLAS